ncbi:MAG TPA: helix-turn-helix domain-containing protein [Candidatus Paceibacterota bacterium]|nr:helix-turn-helix domain-containing protein [Candidatus Paceibacterota bacterium]
MDGRDTDACPIAKVARLLSDTWTMMIVHRLNEGPKRFCELERALDGISTRTLTLKLAKLAEDGMVTKAEDGRYLTTERGKGLRRVERAMMRYQEDYL